MLNLFQHPVGAIPAIPEVDEQATLRHLLASGRIGGKRWHREGKRNLIESDNPDWTDLAIGLGLPPAIVRGRAVDAETSSA